MLKNTAGQKVRVFAFNRISAEPVTGDAVNITCKVAIDNGTPTPLTDINPTEIEDGFYLFDLTQAETNGNTLDFYPESSTTGVQVIVTNHDRQTISSSVEGVSNSPTELRRVKTKELEIEAHDPMKLQRLQERTKAKPVTLGQFPITRVVPKNNYCICDDNDNLTDC